MIVSLFNQISEIFFPKICHLCKEFIPKAGDLHICDDCLESIMPLQSPKCSCCGNPFTSTVADDHLCGACITEPPLFSAARAALIFDGNTRELVHQFKYGKRMLLRRPLALLALPHLQEFVDEFCPELIIPVPLHLKRLKERGFNQAILLGELFAEKWGAKLSRNNLRRIRWTEPQVNLGAAERAVNVKGAFAVSDEAEIQGRRVFLVDDVYTTGSTARECCRMLKQSGAADVAVVTVARGIVCP